MRDLERGDFLVPNIGVGQASQASNGKLEMMTLPEMRTKILMGLRNPERSTQLSKSIGGFMGGVIG